MEVKNTVLLEDRTEHGLDDNTWAWVGDERGLLMQLLGEEVNAQVSVLAGGRGGGDADDLARTTLKDQEIAEADVVAWDGDGVGCVCWLGDGSWQRSSAGATSSYGNVNLFPINMVVMMMVVVTSQDTVSSLVKAVSDGVVVTCRGRLG